ncbi:bifunctional 5,10-methylenetetrahydrofolate dehydrogenase/5,10-methenyltetrahydrofolate cyclohydrolase [Pseudonocardia sp. CA-107938]|uniref:bifunctional 5,10-methylenetetrahydrofolate dehydrogenase/5,10-methenyltetrahydrofolate cyclohydrolase n=1 Tax=Pseudonocardia sp. CA-107938 TaxID=3240021 RepID=UPI003D89EB41
MTAHLIDGHGCARALLAGLADEVAALRTAPVLATLVAGGDHGSALYHRRLQALAGRLGIGHTARELPPDAGQQQVLDAVAALNADPAVSGILLLRPLPPGVDEAAVFAALDPAKDVEAVHPENAGLLALGVPRFVPPTPAAVFHLLDTWLDDVGEARADFYHRSRIVVVGRSNTVGRPAVALGCAREAVVESVDEWADRTRGLGRHTRWADVLIVAAGRPGLIRAEHVTPGTVVIDVGINAVRGPDGRVRTVGDVDATSVAPRARALTPVPGGVGPVTDAWLLRSTVAAARNRTEPSLQEVS